VQFVTAHDRHGGLPENLNIGALADPQATTVIYMGRRTASQLAARLIEAGLPPETPVAAVSNVSRDDQKSLHTTILDLAREVPLPEDGPLIIIIGASVGAARQIPIQREAASNPHNKMKRCMAGVEQSSPALVSQ
jgi:uroporphyrin-III C-methyltransferase/precorrin-2 dehydrogenase/sirohydrochlorin ferrochelatase